MAMYTFETLEDAMKQVYREYLLRVSDVVSFAGICRLAGVNYDNFRKFMCGNDRYLSIDKLRIICETIKNIEKIA
jgi:hypothetical protein